MERDNDPYKKLLKEFLNQYYKGRNRKKQLEVRLKNIADELNAPLGGVGYSPTPRSTTNSISVGSASIVLKMADIEEMILIQRDEVARTMLNIMDILEFLDPGSFERTILEYRYIDCLSWDCIAKEISFSRTTCNHYFNIGILKLLQFGKVRKVLNEYKENKSPYTTLHLDVLL